MVKSLNSRQVTGFSSSSLVSRKILGIWGACGTLPCQAALLVMGFCQLFVYVMWLLLHCFSLVSIRISTNKQIFLGSMFVFVFEKNEKIGSLKYACFLFMTLTCSSSFCFKLLWLLQNVLWGSCKMCFNWFMFRVTSSQSLPITCLLLTKPPLKYDMQPQFKVVPVSTNRCECWGCNCVTL